MTDVPFEEVQNLPAYLLLIVLAVFVSIVAFVFWRVPPAKRRPTILVLLASAIFAATVLLSMRMQTRVTDGAVKISLFYVLERNIPVSEIASVQALEYQPLREFGGWGLRFGSDGRAYSVSGNQAVRLTLRDGEEITIGTERPNDLAHAIETAISR